MKYAVVACIVACMAIAAGIPAKSADSFYIGTWKVAGAVAAPWADAERKPDKAELARLMGKTVTFKAKEIAGPPPFPCKPSHYKEVDYAADMIFQGAFDDMRSKDKSVDPDKIAASLGFAGKSIKTLETGCEIDFHFVDDATAEIGLNNYVYTLKKQ